MDWTSTYFKNLLLKDPVDLEERETALVLVIEEVKVLTVEEVRAVLGAVDQTDLIIPIAVDLEEHIGQAGVVQEQGRAIIHEF